VDTRGTAQGLLIAGGAAIILFVSLFLDWIGPASGWQAFRLVDIVLFLLAVAVAALVGAEVAGAQLDVPLGIAWLTAAAGAIATIITLAFLLENRDISFGNILAVLASAAIAYGGWTSAQERGRRPARPAAGGPGVGPRGPGGEAPPAPPPPP
jgi:hypothetical protein